MSFEEICQEVLLENIFPENIDVKYAVEYEAKNIVSDAALLKRILSNLVSNAIQVMPGGGKLSQLVSHHVFGDVDRNEFSAVMDR